jgi:hypothetical protein
VVFGGSFVAALIGMLLHVKLPDRHLDADSRDVIKLVMGLIGTMAALILGLLIASANSTYNAQSSDLQSLSAKVVLLDRLLIFYGPEAKGAREQLHNAVLGAHDRIWSPAGLRPANLEAANGFVQQLQSLSPKTDAARLIQSRAMQVAESILQTRLLMSEQAGDTIPWPFLIVLIFWIYALFLGFGIFARFNATVTLSLLVGALSISGAIFLILELSTPYQGILQISDAPLVHALAQMGGRP